MRIKGKLVTSTLIGPTAGFRHRAAMLLIVLGIAATAGVCSQAPSPRSSADHARTTAETVKAHTQEILSNPRFAKHITLRQWIREKLGRRDKSNVHLPQGVKTFVSTVAIIWCLLTLLAILGHFVWTIWLLAHPSSTRANDGPGAGPGAAEITDPDGLWDRSQQLARGGEFRGAVTVLLVAMLRRLDASNVLRFHKSKTNGDYVREYPDHLPGRREFVQFIVAFERNIYGGLDIRGSTYEAMNSLAKRIIGDVSQNP